MQLKKSQLFYTLINGVPMKNKSSISTFKKIRIKIDDAIGPFWRRYQIKRWLIVIALSIFFLVSAYLTFEAKTANVKKLQAALEQTTEIYDKDGDKAGTLFAQKGTYVKLNKISPNLQNAVLSTEDKNFYHEYGFSVKGIARAVVLAVRNKITGADYIAGGGSTITQQLVKNALLSQEQTMSRKAREIFLSVEVENCYSKQEILTMYLNNAYFGRGVWGVEDASERYFGVHASQLKDSQAATLAAMLRSPVIYDPIANPKNSRARRNLVLQLMVENKKLPEASAKAAQAAPTHIVNNYKRGATYQYPWFFDSVINEAINKYGLTESDIMNRGYKIYTTLGQRIQTSMQKQFDASWNYPTADVQAASVAVNPKTGGVLAVIGGRGKHVFRGFNRATQMKRQPGSTMKPLAVYAPAIENGYYYDSELSDKETSFGTNHYKPTNENGVYQDKVPMYKALQQSINVPAVWLLNKIGVNTGFDMAQSFGMGLTDDDKNLSLALGGTHTGVSPLQLAQAYGAFANNGTMNHTYFIRKIVDASGKVIVDNDAPKTTKVMSAKTANTMTSMLQGVFSYGTGASSKPYGYAIAGKTGTTEASGTKEKSGSNDKWIVGYTPDLVMATWEGYDNNSSGKTLSADPAYNVGPLFKTEMSAALPYTKGTKFSVPDANVMGAGNTSGSPVDNFFNSFGDASKEVKDNAGKIKDQAKNWWGKVKGLFD